LKNTLARFKNPPANRISLLKKIYTMPALKLTLGKEQRSNHQRFYVDARGPLAKFFREALPIENLPTRGVYFAMEPLICDFLTALRTVSPPRHKLKVVFSQNLHLEERTRLEIAYCAHLESQRMYFDRPYLPTSPEEILFFK